MDYRHTAAFALACIVLIAPAARAATFCVSNATALQNALNSATANNASNTIKVQAGTYLAPQNGFH